MVLIGLGVGIFAVIATSGLILIPIVLGLIGWGVWYSQRPKSRAQRVIAQAKKLEPAAEVLMLHQALQIAPNEPETELACGNLFFDLECWADAAQCYAEYLHHQPSWAIEAKYVQALLNAGQLDEAIQRLEALRAQPALTAEAASSVVANLALAFLLKGDAEQAEALVDQAVGGKRSLGEGLQKCLLIRGIARYRMGQRVAAVRDLERLYAVSSTPDVLRDKTAMQDGSYKLDSPSPYPAWYPHQEIAQTAEAEPSGLPEPVASAQPAASSAPPVTTQVATPAPVTPASEPSVDSTPPVNGANLQSVAPPPGQSGWTEGDGMWTAPDGQMIWDGVAYLSPDRKWRWEDQRWVANSSVPTPAGN